MIHFVLHFLISSPELYEDEKENALTYIRVIHNVCVVIFFNICLVFL